MERMCWFGHLTETTLNNGYLGSRNDEERSEMRYVVSHIYTVYIQSFLAGILSNIRSYAVYMYTVLANPTYVCVNEKRSP